MAHQGTCKLLLITLLSSLIVLIAGQTQSSQDNQQGTHHHRLLDELFNERQPTYNNIIRPVHDETQPINITLQLVLKDIIEVDEMHHQVEIMVWPRLTWVDEFLTWNPEEFGGKDSVVIPAEQVWIPDLVLYNSVNTDDNSEENLGNVKLKADGSISWSRKVLYLFQCTMLLTKFPFDEQNCDLTFASWTYDGSLLNLSLAIDNDVEPFDVYSQYHENGEWALVNSGAVRIEQEYPQLANSSEILTWPELYFTMTLERKNRFYLLTLLIPYYIISALSGLVFVIQPDTGEKMGLATTVLLALVVFNEYVTDIVPPSADYFPLLADYFVIMIFWVGMSVAMTACVLHMYHQDPKTCKWMGPYMRFLVFGILARIVRDSNTQGNAKSVPLAIDNAGNAMHMETKEQNGGGQVSPSGDTTLDKVGNGKLDSDVCRIRQLLEGGKKEKDVDDMMKEVEEAPLQEWREAVRIIDKFFFWVYTIINVLLMVVFLLVSIYFTL